MTCKAPRSLAITATASLLFMTSAVWPVACVVTESGTALEWSMAMGAGSSTHVTVDVAGQAHAVEIERALVAIASVELLRCDHLESTVVEQYSLLNRAHAHGIESPTKMSAPHVINLLAARNADWSAVIGNPPPGAFCAVRVTVGPADIDAIGLGADEEFVASSLLVRGVVRGSVAGEGVPFTVTSTRVHSIDVPFTSHDGVSAPLRIDATMRLAAVEVWLDAPDVLAGVDVTSHIHAQGGLQALQNILASVRVRACVAAPCANSD